MVHQGKILKRQIENKDISQSKAAEMLSLSRSGLVNLFDKVQLPEKHLQKAVEVLGLSREIFFPQLSSQASPPSEVSCWQLLAEARQEIINLQKQIIEMSRPSLNEPAGRYRSPEGG